MKRIIRNWLATTGLSLLLLAVVAAVYGGHAIFIVTVFQTGLANLFIHLGLEVFQGFESRYCLVEIGVEIGYVLAVLIIFGLIFDWYESTPLWILVLMGIVVYFVGCLVDVFRIRNDVDTINRQLQLRRKTERKAE